VFSVMYVRRVKGWLQLYRESSPIGLSAFTSSVTNMLNHFLSAVALDYEDSQPRYCTVGPFLRPGHLLAELTAPYLGAI
jgi:hypothetical protein